MFNKYDTKQINNLKSKYKNLYMYNIKLPH